MDSKFLLTKQKILSLIVIFIFVLFCCIVSIRTLRHISDDSIPLSFTNIQAIFYIGSPDSDSNTCIGDGLINSGKEIYNNPTAVSSVIITAPDNSANYGDSYTIVWETIRYEADHYSVYGSLGEKADTPTINATFANVSQLKNASVSPGDIVSTEGYNTPNDNGGAQYYINTNFTSNITDIRLYNGLIAHLQYGDIVNVASLGIFPNTDCSAKLNEALYFFDKKNTSLQFNDGNYRVKNQIWLKSVYLKGSSNTNFYVDSDFNPYAKRIFLTDIRKHDRTYSLGFEKINFYYITSSNHTLRNEEINLVCLNDIDNCTIRECNFIARNATNDQTFMKSDLLWFQDSSNSNINIEKCNFINETALNIDVPSSFVTVGGCLWFSGNTISSSMDNINISGCNFNTTCRDEALAIWKCAVHNMSITDCNFNIINNYSNNLLALYDGSFKNLAFNNCTFNAIGSTYCFFKLRSFTDDSNISFTECDFINNSINNTVEMNSAFYTNENIPNDTISKSVVLNKCDFIGDVTNAQNFKYIVNVYGGKNYNYELNNCKFSIPLRTSLISTSEAYNCIFLTSKSDINTSSRLTNATNVNNVGMSYDGNTIYSDFTNQFNNSAYATLTFTNNRCKSNGTLAVDNCHTSNLSSDSLIVNNNIFETTYSLFKKIR